MFKNIKLTRIITHDYGHLPTTHEDVTLSESDASCRCCGLLYEQLHDCESSEILEVIRECATLCSMCFGKFTCSRLAFIFHAIPFCIL